MTQRVLESLGDSQNKYRLGAMHEYQILFKTDLEKSIQFLKLEEFTIYLEYRPDHKGHNKPIFTSQISTGYVQTCFLRNQYKAEMQWRQCCFSCWLLLQSFEAFKRRRLSKIVRMVAKLELASPQLLPTHLQTYWKKLVNFSHPTQPFFFTVFLAFLGFKRVFD